MATTLTFKNKIDVPEWRTLAVAPTYSSSQPYLISDYRPDPYANPYIYYILTSASFHRYNTKTDGWGVLPSPTLASHFAGSNGVMTPQWGPRGTIAAGATTTLIPLTTALNAAVGINQLANRGDGTGYRIRILGNAAGSSGLVEERLVVGNTSGTTPTITLDSALSFTPIAGDGYEILSGRIYLLAGLSTAANSWKYYDIVTDSFVAAANSPVSTNADSVLVGLDEGHVDTTRLPGQGYFGTLVATAITGTTLTGQAAGGDAGVTANQYRNFQIRIVQDVAIPTAVGQRRNITSHTAGASPVYTVPVWAVTPSATASYVIENNGDRILMWGTPNTNTNTYSISGNAWDTVTFGAKGGANAGGAWGCHSFAITPDSANNVNRGMIYVGRGGTASTVDVLDITAATTGTWSNSITYSGLGGGIAFGTTSCGIYDPVSNSGKYFYMCGSSQTQNFYRFDVLNRHLEPWAIMRYPAPATGQTGVRMGFSSFVDGVTKIGLIYFIRANSNEWFQILASV